MRIEIQMALLVMGGSLLLACAAQTGSEGDELGAQSAAVSGKPSGATVEDLEMLGFDCNERDVSTTVCTKCYDDGTCLIYECHRWSGECTYRVESAAVDFTGRFQTRTTDNLCVHKERLDWQRGQALHLWACDEGSASQKTWEYDAETGLVRATGHRGMCWHKERADWRNGQRVHLWECAAGAEAQKTWIVDSSTGKVHAASNPSMCVSVWRSVQGESLVLRNCDRIGWNGLWDLREEGLTPMIRDFDAFSFSR